MKRLLLTGAAGRIGSAFHQLHGHEYHLRLVDVNTDTITDSGDHEVITADLADLAICQELCKDIDLVLHLAADPSPQADFYESLLDNNIKTAYNIFRAAKDQGCEKVIFASSIQAISNYPLDSSPHPDMPPKPRNMYAVTKVFGEAMCYYFAHIEGLPSIAVRIGAYGGNRNWAERTEPVDSRTLSAYVSERDLCQLFVKAFAATDVNYAILHGVSDNRFKRMDLTSTRELVDYHPRDDAFALFGTGIVHPERWQEEWNRSDNER